MPILGDLYDELLKQPEPEAARIAAALELYVSGSLNVFNHRTNVELENRLVCFDIKQLGKQLKKLGMLIVQDQVWNRVTVNRAAKKSTRYFMDEFHLLLKDEQTAAYSVEIWKRFQKMGRHTHGNHAERQRFACFPRSREHLWCDTLTHKHRSMRVKLHGLMAMRC